MQAELGTFAGPLLAIGGVVLQFAIRQFKGLGDGIYHAIALGLALVVFALTNDTPTTKYAVIQGIIWLSGALPAIWGGTFAMSNIAKAAVKAGADTPNLLVPLTNSV